LHIHGEVQARVKRVKAFLEVDLQHDARVLNSLLERIEEDKQLQSIWLTRDRDALLNYVLPLFDDVLSKYMVTHFYFIDLDKVCFLRVHKPDDYGDTIKRFTLASAALTGKPNFGVELDRFGNLALRVVYPWVINGEVAGYIELAQDFVYITPELSMALGVELYVVLDKRYLKQDFWEKGLRFIGQQSSWDLFKDFVVLDSTLETVAPELTRYWQVPHSLHKNFIVRVMSGNRPYYIGFSQILDASGTDIGDIVVLQDASAEALAESEARFRTLVSSIPGAVYRCAADSNWTMFFISDAIEHICGYPASDFLSNCVRTFTSIIHPDDQQMVEQVVMDGVQRRAPYTIEYRIVRAVGSVRWVYEKGQGVYNQEDQILWLVRNRTQRG